MTVQVQFPIKKYTGNASAVSFAYPYLLQADADMKVYINGVLQASGYAITGIGNPSGGSVVFTIPPPSGSLVILQRLVGLTQDTDFQEGASISTDTLERVVDRLTLQIQDGRAAALEIVGGDLLDAKNQRIINLANPVNGQDAVTKAWAESGMASQLATAITQATISTTKAGEASASATAALSSQNAAATSEGLALAHRNTALAQAGIATTKAAESAASAAAALASQNAASASAATATAQATISTTKANQSAASATASAASATAAQGVYEDLIDALGDGPVAEVNGKGGIVVLVPADLGLGNVNNTSDAVKPISAAQQVAITQAAPPGLIQFYAANWAPAGWLKANGAAVSRTAYASLFAVIGVFYGSGDGSTTFNVPDLRGEFLRAWDDGRNVDPNRGFNTVQLSQNQWHAHGVSDPGHGHGLSDSGHAHGVYDPGHVHSAWTDGQGEHSHHVNDPGHAHGAGVRPGGGVSYAGGGANSAPAFSATDAAGTGVYLNSAGFHGHNVGIGGAGTGIGIYGASANLGVQGSGTGIWINGQGGDESRPRNVSLMAIIKY